MPNWHEVQSKLCHKPNVKIYIFKKGADTTGISLKETAAFKNEQLGFLPKQQVFKYY